jgi:hypothetical protein
MNVFRQINKSDREIALRLAKAKHKLKRKNIYGSKNSIAEIQNVKNINK